jgi:hypothetical protein
MTELHADTHRPSLRARLYARLLAREDIAWLCALRVLFGLMMAASMLRFIAYGWIDEFFVRPAFHFKYWGFAWVQALPGPQMHALFWVLAALALCVALGLCFRLAAAGFAIGFTYLQLIDVTTYLNHYYLASLLAFLLALSPAHRSFSLDAWLRPRLRSQLVPAAYHHLFRFQVGVVYTFAGLAKAQSDWLLHAQPLRTWLGARTGLPVLGPLFAQEWAAPLMSWGGFLFDTSIAWLLLYRSTRAFAFVLVLGFHGMTGLLFPIGMFPVIMIVAALVFFSPSWPRVLLARVLGRNANVPTPPVARPEPWPRTPRRRAHDLVFGAALVYCALQLVLPLRHLAYPGSVLWHEQGMRLSWRVMVREKNAALTFFVRDRRSGKSWQVAPRRYLTRLQEREMSGQPDLILQLAHHVRDEFARRTGGPVEVRVEALVSLNSRSPRHLIDPTVDLAQVHDGVARARWIASPPPEPPPHIEPI